MDSYEDFIALLVEGYKKTPGMQARLQQADPSTTLEDMLGFDSNDRFELGLTIWYQFGVTLENDDLDGDKTLNDVYHAVKDTWDGKTPVTRECS